MSVTINHY